MVCLVKLKNLGRLLKLGGICLVFFFLNTGACEEEKKYGEECNSSTSCSNQDLLACQSGICTCSPSTSLLYEEILGRCVARVGEKCGGVIRGDWTVSIGCTEGALCDESSGGCVCTDDYFRLPNGTCSRKRKYMETCKADLECAKDYRNSRPLVCDNGYCSCDKRFQIYDAERRQCVTLVGGDCNSEIALPASASFNSNECINRATCVQGKCICGAHYTANSHGQCKLAYGEPCGIGRICSDLQLTCLDGMCQCKFPLHQNFDPLTKECLSLVSGPCTLNFTYENGYEDMPKAEPPKFFQRCTKNAVCVDQGYFTGCECLDGYVQKKDGECAPGYGVACEADECDPITPLFCRNNKCDCEDELQLYDAGRKKCLGLVGSRCILGQQVQQCVEFCSCIQVGIELQGKCLCDKYSEEVENRTCIYQ